MNRKMDTDPGPPRGGNTDPGLGPTSPGPAPEDAVADALLEGLKPSDREEPVHGGTRESGGKIAAAYHASPKPAPARHKTPPPDAAAVIVSNSQEVTLDEPNVEAPRPPKQHLETTAPPAPRASGREKMAALALTALIVMIAGATYLYYRSTASEVAAPRAPAPLQTAPSRLSEVPEPAPVDPAPVAEPTATTSASAAPSATTAAPNATAAPKPKPSARGDKGVTPPDDYDDLKQRISH